MGEGEASDWVLLKNDLVNLTLSRRHFLLFPVRKIDDQVVWLLRSLVQIHRS